MFLGTVSIWLVASASASMSDICASVRRAQLAFMGTRPGKELSELNAFVTYAVRHMIPIALAQRSYRDQRCRRRSRHPGGARSFVPCPLQSDREYSPVRGGSIRDQHRTHNTPPEQLALRITPPTYQSSSARSFSSGSRAIASRPPVGCARWSWPCDGCDDDKTSRRRCLCDGPKGLVRFALHFPSVR